MANQKIGMEVPSKDTTRTMWSTIEFLRTAEAIPAGSPKRRANTDAARPSSKVAGKNLNNSPPVILLSGLRLPP